MTQSKYQETYKQLIKQWSESILKARPVGQFYHTFLYKVKQSNKIAIFYDDRIADIILSLLKSLPFQVFSRNSLQQQNENRRRSLFTIINVLKQQQFIGKHQLRKVQPYKDAYLQDKLKLFLSHCHEQQYQGDILLNLWQSIMEMDLISFWNYAEQFKIKDLILIEIYRVVAKCKDMASIKSISAYIDRIQRKNQPKQILVEPVIPRKRYRRCDRSKLDQTLSRINPISFNLQRQDYKKRKSQLYDSSWFNTAKYELYTQYIQSVKETSNTYSVLLTEIAYSKSLFFNPKHQPIIRSISSFIHDVQKKIDHHKIVSYQYFGSIRSTLALSCQFDIDLTSIKAVSSRGRQRQMSREDIVDLLFEIKKKLESSYPKWLSKLTVFKYEKIKVPFLKIEIDKYFLKEQFSLQGIQKLDVTIGNKTAIKNSEIISYFAHVPQITCFCLLVKLWAKNNQVVNTKFPMKGLSSYGIILMCLYYLMQTKQIYFLPFKDEEEFDIDKVKITPNLDFFNIKDLEENFLGFLEFYKETGVFQRQMKIVCLISDSPNAREKFDHDIVYNMYDFLDKTNPGRLPLKDKDNIFLQFERAIRIMKFRNKQQIQELILNPK